MFIVLLLSMMACSMVSAADGIFQWDSDDRESSSYEAARPCEDDSSSLSSFSEGELVESPKRNLVPYVSENRFNQCVEQVPAHAPAKSLALGMKRSETKHNLMQYGSSAQTPVASYFDGCQFKFEDHEELSSAAPKDSPRGAASSSSSSMRRSKADVDIAQYGALLSGSGVGKSLAIDNLHAYGSAQQSFSGDIPKEVHRVITQDHLSFARQLLKVHFFDIECWQGANAFWQAHEEKTNNYLLYYCNGDSNMLRDVASHLNALIKARKVYASKKNLDDQGISDYEVICNARKAYDNPIVDKNKPSNIRSQWSDLEHHAWDEWNAAKRVRTDIVHAIMDNKRLILQWQTKRNKR